MTETPHLLSAELAGRLRIEILSEKLRSGEKLTEQSLCKNYGVSRTPVREALKILESEGLVEMIPNRGAFAAGLSKDDIRDMYVLRAQNEIQAICWAIERGTEQEIETIEETLDFMRFYTNRGDAKRMRPINAGFHKYIAAASHNRVLIETLSRIQDYIRYSACVRPYTEADLGSILGEHTAIFAAIKAGDRQAGARAVREHVESSLRRANI